MKPHTPETKAGIASAEEGEVILEGPDGVAVSMTPEAADGTAQSLKTAAGQARLQRERHQAGLPE